MISVQYQGCMTRSDSKEFVQPSLVRILAFPSNNRNGENVTTTFIQGKLCNLTVTTTYLYH